MRYTSYSDLFKFTIEYINSIFSTSPIPSHDTSHHIRTWLNAKRISDIASQKFNSNKLEALMIACMFHDTGLSITKSERHGHYSTQIFIDFCKLTGYYSEYNKCICNAISDHDNKNYINRYKKDPFSIYNILPVADDLDALGYIGIFRYAEIYLMRGFCNKDIPKRIISNVNKRWNNLSKIYKDSNLTTLFEEKYQKLISFYNQTDKGVVYLFINFILKNIDNYKTIEEFTQILVKENNPILRNIAIKIEKEIGAFY